MSSRVRLDQLLVDRGLARSRSQAVRSIMAGEVRVGPGRDLAPKPGMVVAKDAPLEVVARPPYVSRGGQKLERALHVLGIGARARRCLDVGASTGGFTDCLLRAGAAHVVAVDVGYGELDWSLRNDPRVTVIERRNARELRRDELPYAPELVTVDVSFIGLAKVLPALAALVPSVFDVVALVKPQFEVGRGKVGRGGVVRSAEDRLETLVSAGEAARELGLAVLGYCSSGLPGPAGNRETFIWCAEGERGSVGDLRLAALEAEPDARVEQALEP